MTNKYKLSILEISNIRNFPVLELVIVCVLSYARWNLRKLPFNKNPH